MDPADRDQTSRGAEAEGTQTEQSAGQLLRTARLARGMSIEDVARQLRLSVRQIAALEEDDYDKFPSATFLRGFVRNYAKLLQVDEGPLLRQLQQSLPPLPAPTISYQIEGIPFPSNQKRGRRNLIIAGAAVLALLLLIYEIYSGNEGNKEKQQPAAKVETTTEAEQVVTPPQFELPSAVSTGGTDSVASGEEVRMVEQKHGTQAPVPTPAPPAARQAAPSVIASESANAATSEPTDGADVLRLVFEGESWVEVKDSRGRLLLSKVNSPGTEQVLYGKSPFSLAIGNASEVKLAYNNKPVDLSPYINAYGGTARLSLK
ncbi:cytoskeleton protein RodZ [Nitrosospira sp. Nl5]|uniref:RodZ domain-containing protein n=1 Tax=Nitrosospira sp. Nl5 TaxID=200120 RepID=UPI000891C85C|nr:RodZ domain-containing protein [Nitrosospira sp. Nl5]SCY21951.1 cytoskeleton protein RodZ [Nitrosospira sp. Nl5]